MPAPPKRRRASPTLWLFIRVLRLQKRLERAPLLHPFLAGFYPVLSLYSLNADQLWPGMMALPIAAAAAATALLLAAFRGPLGRWDKAAFQVSVSWALFYGLGYADDLLILSGVSRLWVLRLAVVLPGAGLSAAAWAWLKGREDMRDPTLLANIAAVMLFLFPFARIGVQAATRRGIALKDAGEVAAAPTGTRRDVYDIILDAYARGDVLRDLFKYDNGAFLKGLEKRGFQIAPGSRSNYAFTALSLASSLNMTYLDDVAAAEGKDGVALDVPMRMIQDNRVLRFFKGQGYKTIQLKSGWAIDDDNPHADVQVGEGSLLEFQAILLRASAAGVFLGKHLQDNFRDHVLDNLEILGQIAGQPGPKYVFAHFVCPHEPYVFDRQGRSPIEDYGKTTYKERWAKKTRYVDQLHFISFRILETIDRIQDRSSVPPVIILQSDHGSASLGFWRPPPPPVAFERMSNLCALYLPGFRGRVPADITNVNVFRLVLDTYFDAKMGPLPDRCYYSFYTRPYDWTDVTQTSQDPPSFDAFKPTPEQIRAARVDKGQ